MAGEAKVRSIDALEDLRSDLIVFLTKAKRAVHGGLDELQATRIWLQQEQPRHWQMEIRRSQKAVEKASLELQSARFSEFKSSEAVPQAALRKAREALAHAEDRLRATKRWARDFETASGPQMKRLEALRDYLEHDLPKAVVYLAQAKVTLEAYTERAAPPGGPSLPSPDPDRSAAAPDLSPPP